MMLCAVHYVHHHTAGWSAAGSTHRLWLQLHDRISVARWRCSSSSSLSAVTTTSEESARRRSLIYRLVTVRLDHCSHVTNKVLQLSCAIVIIIHWSKVLTDWLPSSTCTYTDGNSNTACIIAMLSRCTPISLILLRHANKVNWFVTPKWDESPSAVHRLHYMTWYKMINKRNAEK